jgi:hypothetical protein
LAGVDANGGFGKLLGGSLTFVFEEIIGRTFRVSVIAEDDVPAPAPTEHPAQFLDPVTVRLIFGDFPGLKGCGVSVAGGGGGGGGAGAGADGLFPIVSTRQNKYHEETR